MTQNKKPLVALLDLVGDAIKKKAGACLERGQTMWNAMSYDDRLAIACHFTAVFARHLKEGGSYRELIYDRLEFDSDAYSILGWHGLLDIHNAIIETASKSDNVSTEQGTDAQ